MPLPEPMAFQLSPPVLHRTLSHTLSPSHHHPFRPAAVPIHRRSATHPLPARFLFRIVASAERLLWATNVSKTHDGQIYQFRDESISLHRGDKVAILGANGSGKSTLLSLLAGISLPDDGTVQVKKGCVAALVAQDLPLDFDLSEPPALAALRLATRHSPTPALRAALRHVTAIAALDHAPDAHNDEAALGALADATAAMDSTTDAWQVDSHLSTIMQRLDVPASAELSSLSGGQRRRVAIAAALVAQPSIILLDEVTNHLSIDCIQFLEDILSDPALTVVVISHDRTFVDNVCTTAIWELADASLHRYPPGYDAFLNFKADRLDSEQKKFHVMRKALRKELEWLRRQPRARGTKNKSRVEDTHKLQSAVQQHRNREEGRTRALQSVTARSARLGGDVVSLEGVTVRRNGKLIVKDFTYTFQRGERVGIVGGNGVGKSTLLRAILGMLPLESGTVHVGDTVVFGYYEQEGIDLSSSLSEGAVAVRGVSNAEDMRVMDFVSELQSQYDVAGSKLPVKSGRGKGGGGASFSSAGGGNGVDPDAAEARLADQLEQLSYSTTSPVKKRTDEDSNGSGNMLRKMTTVMLLDEFGFDRSKQHTLVRHLSGGERRRLQLMALLLRNANYLLMDEVTNDLDLNTLTMVEEALVEYEGVLMLCSHDRMMLDRLVDHLLVVEGDGRVTLVEGKFSDYLRAQKDRSSEEKRQRKAGISSRTEPSASSASVVVGSLPSGSGGENGAVKQRKLNYKERKEYGRLEGEIEACQKECDDLTKQLAAEGDSAGYEAIQKWSERLALLEQQVHDKTERWMHLAEMVEE